MARYFTHYWSNQTWNDHKEDTQPGDKLGHTASNVFRKRGVTAGDFVFVVTNINGTLHILCYLEISDVLSQEEAEGLLDGELWEAKDHLIAARSSELNFNNAISQADTEALLFVTPSGPMPLKIKSNGLLDQQTLRGVRELTKESGEWLLRELTKNDPLIEDNQQIYMRVDFDEADGGFVETAYAEGGANKSTVNRYSRNPAARKACIHHHGTICAVCGFDFNEAYGESGRGYIQIHHLKALSTSKEKTAVNPTTDLIPVCANCHAIIHRRDPMYSLQEMRSMLTKTS